MIQHLKTVGYTICAFGLVGGSTLAVGLAVALIFWVVGLSFGDCPRC